MSQNIIFHQNVVKMLDENCQNIVNFLSSRQQHKLRLLLQEIIFSEFEEREEGQNCNNAFVTTMRKIQFITKANQFSRNKVDGRIMAIGHT